MSEVNASEELLKLRKESEDWAVPEYPITDEATRGADDPEAIGNQQGPEEKDG